jgi:UPF0271 protein
VRIDLNCDLGEGYGAWTLGEPGLDAALLDLVTSANVACGFHAGDPAIMAVTCARAVERGVGIGAHVGYRDLVGFGRRALDVPPDVLRAETAYQLGALAAVARAAGGRVTYVKPHGALYNTVVHDEAQARAVVDAVVGFDPGLAVLCLPGSVLLEVARAAGLRGVAEAFADRGYTAQGTLVPRDRPGALVTEPALAAARAVRLVRDGVVVAVDGTPVELAAESVCVHSDTPGALAVLRAVHAAFEVTGVRLEAFTA